jgi:hypothetical protein
MRREIFRSEVGLKLDQATGQATAADLADEDLSEEVAGYR